MIYKEKTEFDENNCMGIFPQTKYHLEGKVQKTPFLPYNGKKLCALGIMAFKSIQNLRIQIKNEVNELMLKNKSLCKVLKQLTCDSSSPI